MTFKDYIKKIIECEPSDNCDRCDNYRELLRLHNKEMKDLIERIPGTSKIKVSDCEYSYAVMEGWNKHVTIVDNFKQSELKKLND